MPPNIKCIYSMSLTCSLVYCDHLSQGVCRLFVSLSCDTENSETRRCSSMELFSHPNEVSFNHFLIPKTTRGTSNNPNVQEFYKNTGALSRFFFITPTFLTAIRN